MTYSVLNVFFNSFSDSGLLTFDFKLYSDSSGIVVDPDTTIDLGTALYGQVSVEGEGFPDLDVHFASVVATAGNLNSETLITDG